MIKNIFKIKHHSPPSNYRKHSESSHRPRSTKLKTVKRVCIDLWRVTIWIWSHSCLWWRYCTSICCYLHSFPPLHNHGHFQTNISSAALKNDKWKVRKERGWEEKEKTVTYFKIRKRPQQGWSPTTKQSPLRTRILQMQVLRPRPSYYPHQ